MARSSHALKFREWALDHSPTGLKGIAERRWKLLAPHFQKRLSPLWMQVWREGVFTQQTDADRRRFDQDFVKALVHGTMFEEVVLFGAWTERLAGEVGVPVVCDRTPFEVPVTHVHLFDIRPSDIRESFDAALSDSDVNGLRTAIRELRHKSASPVDEFSALTKIRPLMDRVVPMLLRATDGFGIHNEFARHWIVFNARTARKGVDPRDREAARESIARIGAALQPSEWAGEGPNEAGLMVDYRFIRENADSVLRKKYNNPELKRADLHKRLPQFERSLVDRFADTTPRQFALELLSARYGLKPTYLWNLIKRGNLYLDITLQWRKALLSSPQAQPPAGPQTDLTINPIN